MKFWKRKIASCVLAASVALSMTGCSMENTVFSDFETLKSWQDVGAMAFDFDVTADTTAISGTLEMVANDSAIYMGVPKVTITLPEQSMDITLRDIELYMDMENPKIYLSTQTIKSFGTIAGTDMDLSVLGEGAESCEYLSLSLEGLGITTSDLTSSMQSIADSKSIDIDISESDPKASVLYALGNISPELNKIALNYKDKFLSTGSDGSHHITLSDSNFDDFCDFAIEVLNHPDAYKLLSKVAELAGMDMCSKEDFDSSVSDAKDAISEAKGTATDIADSFKLDMGTLVHSGKIKDVSGKMFTMTLSGKFDNIQMSGYTTMSCSVSVKAIEGSGKVVLPSDDKCFDLSESVASMLGSLGGMLDGGLGGLGGFDFGDYGIDDDYGSILGDYGSIDDILGGMDDYDTGDWGSDDFDNFDWDSIDFGAFGDTDMSGYDDMLGGLMDSIF